MRFSAFLLFLILFFPLAYAQPKISDWSLSRTVVYEDETIIFSVHVSSNTSISSVKAGLINYTLAMENPISRAISLSLATGNATNGTWIYLFKEKEGIYEIVNITAKDSKNSTTIYEDTFGTLAFKVKKSLVTINCNTSFTLNRTTFNSSELVDYTIKFKNLGSSLTNLNFSIESQIETTSKEIPNKTLASGQSLDLEFQFTAPNVSEDKSYSFLLYVSSDECNFTFPFQFQIKKLIENITRAENTTQIAWDLIIAANNSIQLAKSQNKDVTKAKKLFDQAIESYEKENYQTAKELANQAKYEAEIAEEIKGFQIPLWLIVIIFLIAVITIVMAIILLR